MTTSTTSGPPSLAPLRIMPTPRHRPAVIIEADPWTPEDADHPGYVQDALAVDFGSPAADLDERPTGRSDLPDPVQWAAHLAQGLVEVMAGSRPLRRCCAGPPRRCMP